MCMCITYILFYETAPVIFSMMKPVVQLLPTYVNCVSKTWIIDLNSKEFSMSLIATL